jgi:hypothetical protein
MARASGMPPSEPTPPGWLVLLRIAVTWPLAAATFVLRWAGLNAGWGAALDAAIAPAVFAEPCQRPAGTTAPLTGSTHRRTGRRGGLIEAPQRQFGAWPVGMSEATWDREFAARESWLSIAANLRVLFLDIFAAVIGAIWLALLVDRLIGRLRRAWSPG